MSEAVLTSTHNLCFEAKIRKNIYPCKPQFYYIKVGCKGVFVTRTCFRDENVRIFCNAKDSHNFPTKTNSVLDNVVGIYLTR